jgi:3-deoxy-manno-octulosonate cytidylyltransferase (CMP-KDO synthetase)
MNAVDACVVATDAPEIEAVCRELGASVVRTAATHASGTDRVAEVARMPEFAGYDIVVNVQGDEPFVTEQQVAAAVAEVRKGSDVGTVATPVGSREAWLSPAVVKVARRSDGAALYFSRAPIPWKRDGAPEADELESPSYLRHVGLYAFRRDALLQWSALPVGALEEIEKLEQLRALAAGLRIGVAVVPRAEGGVDTLEDARRAEVLLRAAG